MIGLGIESTAHTFSCAVLDTKGKRSKILSDIRDIYLPPKGEGIHPREASRHHVEKSSNTLREAMKKAKISVKDIDIISYAAGPGLGPCLRVGAVVARTLSSFYKIPIYPVNHAIGHIELGKPVFYVQFIYQILLLYFSSNYSMFRFYCILVVF